MESTAAFRKMLVQELQELINSQQIDPTYVQMQYVETKRDVLGEFIDEYGNDVLRYRQFAADFNEAEISELAQLVMFFKAILDQVGGSGVWESVLVQARRLLETLENGEAHLKSSR